jgi:hypothetical protein
MLAPNDEHMAYCLLQTAEMLSHAAIKYLERERDFKCEDNELMHSVACLGLLKKGHELLGISRSYLQKAFQWPE